MYRGKRYWLIGLPVALLLAALLGGGAPGRAQEGICDSAPQTRLSVGGWAVVTDIVAETEAGGLRMRAEPRIEAEVVAVLPARTVARVIDGPACNDGFQWWRLHQEDGVEGWAAEGRALVYYLAPTYAPPAATPTPLLIQTNTPRPPRLTPAGGAAQPTPTPPATAAPGEGCPGDPTPGYLRVGAAARVADQAHPVRLREEPSTQSIFTEMVYQDATLRVVEGPVCADDYRWWRVEVGGRPGWTVEAANGRYLLIDPANPPPEVVLAEGLSPIPPSPTPPPPEATLAPTPRPQTPPAVARRAVYTAEGTLLVVGGDDGVRLYDADSFALQGRLAVGAVLDFVRIEGALHVVAWTPQGISVAALPGGEVRALLAGGPYDPQWAAAAPDGRWLILGPTSDGSTATLWDLSTASPPQTTPFWWPGWGVVSAAFSPDGRYVLVNDIVHLRRCEVAGPGCLFDLVRDDFLAAGIFGDVGWSGDGEMMIGFSDRFWLWDGNPLGVGITVRTTLGMQDPRRVALNADATRGAIAARTLMELWSLGGEVYYTNHVVELPGVVHSLAFRPGSAQLAVAAGEAVVVYDSINGSVIRQME